MTNSSDIAAYVFKEMGWEGSEDPSCFIGFLGGFPRTRLRWIMRSVRYWPLWWSVLLPSSYNVSWTRKTLVGKHKIRFSTSLAFQDLIRRIALRFHYISSERRHAYLSICNLIYLFEKQHYRSIWESFRSSCLCLREMSSRFDDLYHPHHSLSRHEVKATDGI